MASMRDVSERKAQLGNKTIMGTLSARDELCNILRMSDGKQAMGMAMSPEEARRLGKRRATRLLAVRAVVALAPRIRAIIDRELEGDGLTTQQAALLTVARNGPTLSEAARALATTRQNTKQIVDALVRKGFVELEPDRDDQRATRLRVTAKSDAYWEAHEARHHEPLLRLFDGLPPAAVATCVDVLWALVERASEPTTAPAPARRKAERRQASSTSGSPRTRPRTNFS
jgi:DNA-binding MarR family transcriptional regulator